MLAVKSLGQATYTDKGHWLGGRAGYVPSRENLAAILMYEYRFDRYWSAAFDLTGLGLAKGFALIIAANLKLRIPILKYNKNLYGQFGFGSGSVYPILQGALGFEYALTEKVSLFVQYRKYANFDDLHPERSIYSVGVNIDVTPASVRQSYLLN